MAGVLHGTPVQGILSSMKRRKNNIRKGPSTPLWVLRAVWRMKLGKAAGPGEVSVEAWKVLGDCGVNQLVDTDPQ